MLSVKDLLKHFPVREYRGVFPTTLQTRAVDGISFDVDTGKTLGLVGESGCGKTTTGRLITSLLQPSRGQVVFAGPDLSQRKEKHLRPYRSAHQIIFPDPYSSL